MSFIDVVDSPTERYQPTGRQSAQAREYNIIIHEPVSTIKTKCVAMFKFRIIDIYIHLGQIASCCGKLIKIRALYCIS